jgi:hypothetical protein
VFRAARRFGFLPVLALLVLPKLALAADPDWGAMPLTTHGTLQGVTSTGAPTFSPTSFPIKMRGVVINNFDEMLDNTANFIPFTVPTYAQLGGQWQVFFQSIDPADPAGSCMFMAQNYGTTPEHQDDAYSYSNEEWNAETARLNWLVDPNDPTPETPTLPLVQLREGCLVEVHVRAGRHYAGKFNVNEDHNNAPAYDFDIVLLDRDYGVPDPVAITMDDIMDSGGTFLFGSDPRSGAELYQGRLVTLEGVTITNSENWSRYGEVTVSDGSRDFLVHLGYNDAFDTAVLPVGTIDVTGVFDQEKFGLPLTDGYLMWATRPDAFAPHESQIPGDANTDGVVDDADASVLGVHWLTPSGASWFDGDFNGDGRVSDADAAILAAHWHEGIVADAAVPEPAASVLLAIGALALTAASARRWRCLLRG